MVFENIECFCDWLRLERVQMDQNFKPSRHLLFFKLLPLEKQKIFKLRYIVIKINIQH